MLPADIEQAKHTASWLNSLATALATAGAIVPFIARATGTLPVTSDFGTLWTMWAISLTFALTLHIVGRKILSEI